MTASRPHEITGARLLCMCEMSRFGRNGRFGLAGLWNRVALDAVDLVVGRPNPLWDQGSARLLSVASRAAVEHPAHRAGADNASRSASRKPFPCGCVDTDGTRELHNPCKVFVECETIAIDSSQRRRWSDDTRPTRRTPGCLSGACSQ